MNDKKVYGLTGGIGSGKSTVADIFFQYGAAVVDTDKIAHQIVEAGQPAHTDIVQHFGKEILNPDLSIDRVKLAKKVFHNQEERKKLEAITHPRIMKEAFLQIQRYKEQPCPVIFIDVPLLFETGLNHIYYPVVLVYCDLDERIKRILVRDNTNEEDARSRINAQMSLEEKKAKSDYIIDNSKDLETTKKQVLKLWPMLIA